jgi:hypothetical protein
MSTWTYSRYRAALKRDGKIFAIVTPNLSDGLSRDDAKLLVGLLNNGEQFRELMSAGDTLLKAKRTQVKASK